MLGSERGLTLLPPVSLGRKDSTATKKGGEVVVKGQDQGTEP